MMEAADLLTRFPRAPLPEVSLAEWAATVPAHGVCTFEVQRGATQWSVEPASWRPEQEATAQPCHRYIVLTVDPDYPLIDVSTVDQLGAVAEVLTNGAEGAPARVWGAIGCHPWRPLALDLVAAALQATSEGRAVGVFAEPLPRDFPRLAVLLQLATLHPSNDDDVLARLLRGETVQIASALQRLTRGST
jgi:hypothetical protein